MFKYYTHILHKGPINLPQTGHGRRLQKWPTTSPAYALVQNFLKYGDTLSAIVCQGYKFPFNIKLI